MGQGDQRERWYCIATTGRRERVAASALEAQEILTFAPKLAVAGRTALPQLFPGYVLARALLGPLREVLALWRQSHYLSAVGIHNLVGICGRPSAVEDEFVQELILHTEDGIFVPPGQVIVEQQHAKIEPGTPVRILAGPFANLVARFESMRGRERSVVLVSMLGSHRVVEVDRASIEPFHIEEIPQDT